MIGYLVLIIKAKDDILPDIRRVLGFFLLVFFLRPFTIYVGWLLEDMPSDLRSIVKHIISFYHLITQALFFYLLFKMKLITYVMEYERD